jgi:hypothetical protein
MDIAEGVNVRAKRRTWEGLPARYAEIDETLHKPIVAEWISRFNDLVAAEAEAKKRHKQTIFAIGKALLEAKEQLSKDDFTVAVTKSGVGSMPNAYKYMRIANTKHFQDPKIFPHLPTSLGTLSDLAAKEWTKEDIKEGVDNKLITPETERSDLERIHKIIQPLDMQPSQGSVYNEALRVEVDETWRTEDQQKIVSGISELLPPGKAKLIQAKFYWG